jgi:hypothetical protein
MSYDSIKFIVITVIMMLAAIYALWIQWNMYRSLMEVARIRELERISAMSDEARLCELQLASGSIYCQSPQAAALDAKIKLNKQNAIDAARWRMAKKIVIFSDGEEFEKNIDHAIAMEASCH